MSTSASLKYQLLGMFLFHTALSRPKFGLQPWLREIYWMIVYRILSARYKTSQNLALVFFLLYKIYEFQCLQVDKDSFVSPRCVSSFKFFFNMKVQTLVSAWLNSEVILKASSLQWLTLDCHESEDLLLFITSISYSDIFAKHENSAWFNFLLIQRTRKAKEK